MPLHNHTGFPITTSGMTNGGNGDRGVALVIVLWITVILSSVAAAAAYLARLELRQANYPAQELMLRTAAISEVEKIKAALYSDRNSFDNHGENWYSGTQKSDNAASTETMSSGGVQAYVTVEDEESKVNLNSAVRESLAKLPCFRDKANGNELIDSLIDWRDADNVPLVNGGESEYYRRLNPPRSAKNASLDCLDELRLVKGFNREDIDSFGAYCTVFSNGKININTASFDVLSALPGVTGVIAEKIIRYRQGSDGRDGTADDVPFCDEQQVRQILGESAFRETYGRISFTSNNFKVRVAVSNGKLTKVIETMILREGKLVRIKYWREL